MGVATVKLGEREWEFDFTNPSNKDAYRLEELYGTPSSPATYVTWLMAFRMKNAKAMTCLVYLLRKRNEPQLKFSEVTFPWNDLTVIPPEVDEEEVAEEAVDPTAGAPTPPKPTGKGRSKTSASST